MAATQREAVAKARSERPGIILSDVLLREGTGPLAVETIIAEQGSIPVIFITGNPELCSPCEPPHLILEKPAEAQSLMRAFADMAPI